MANENDELFEPYTMYRDRTSGLIAAADIVEDTPVLIGKIKFVQTAGNQSAGIKAGKRRVAELLDAKGNPKFTTLDGKPLRWIINETNAKTLLQLIGTSIPAYWTGRVVTLFPHTITREGKQVACIRVREKFSPYDKGPSTAHQEFMKSAKPPSGSPPTNGPVPTSAERSPEEIAREFMGGDE